VLVDSQLPFVEDGPVGTLTSFSLAEKAYAKLRYCYKAIMGVGVQQILLEVTGRTSLRHCGDTQQEREAIFDRVVIHLGRGDFVVVLAEGEADRRLRVGEEEVDLFALQPYYACGKAEELRLYPGNLPLALKTVV
jgi:hypothetical protein